MSSASRVRRPAKPPAWVRAQVRRDLACPDCASVVRLGYRDEQLEAQVDHDPTCPRVPPEHRERGELRYTTFPVAVTARGRSDAGN